MREIAEHTGNYWSLVAVLAHEFSAIPDLHCWGSQVHRQQETLREPRGLVAR
jgi:hypothetical protein